MESGGELVQSTRSNQTIVVDLDGTLLLTDTLIESLFLLVLTSPLSLLMLPLWLGRGRAYTKRKIAERVQPDVTTLPYNLELLSWLEKQSDEGRDLVLCTAADNSIAERIASHLGIFSRVLASDGIVNMKGTEKARVLVGIFGENGFCYAGDSRADIDVWQVSASAVICNATDFLVTRVTSICSIETIIPRNRITVNHILQSMRLHQWAKNALIFVPVLAAHKLDSLETLATLLLAFISISFCASSVYILNDLLDLENDRQHPRKRQRVFASGAAPLWLGIILSPLFLAVSIILSLSIGLPFILCLGLYYSLTLLYSFKLKQYVLIDCLLLAALYTIRIFAGAAAIYMGVSFWLLAFSIFLFLSLAFVKRYAELTDTENKGLTRVSGRGYRISDSDIVKTMGIVAGYISVLILALYIDSNASESLYVFPELVWGCVAILLYWISWIWVIASRGEMHDDPLVFALSERVSLVSGLLFCAVALLGSIGPPW